MRDARLTDRVVVVTGGNGGIGLGIAQAVVDAGAAVAVWGRDEAKNERARATLEDAGADVLVQRCDVRDEDAVRAAFANTLERFGKVDCLVANAGVGRYDAFTETTLEQWRSVTAVNLDGAFLCLREAARHMVERGEGGSLVAISSVSAIHGAPRMQPYAASKAGIIAVMRGLAVELARYRVRCNSLLPGWTETDMNARLRKNEKFLESTTSRTPVRRWGTPEDLGPAAVFLADPTYTFHTGDTIVVDGGYTIF
jgi:NAD(P)-dependent dehydrogenase (short-subunit alcohol dehydrogenase family)